jgi:hypothetical protein
MSDEKIEKVEKIENNQEMTNHSKKMNKIKKIINRSNDQLQILTSLSKMLLILLKI